MTTTTEALVARPAGTAGRRDAGRDPFETSALREMRGRSSGARPDAAEVPVADPSAGADRGPLTFDELLAIRSSLENLTALEANRGDRIATVGVEPVAAYELGIRFAVHDAMVKLSDGSYGDCEECRHPIPWSRLRRVPYARRCAGCHAQEERRWAQVGRLLGSVVRRFGWEPQGRSGDADSPDRCPDTGR